MANPNVVIRHAKTAVHLIVQGAMAAIEKAEMAEPVSDNEAINIDRLSNWNRELMDGVTDALSELEVYGSRLNRMEEMIEQMAAELGRPECPTAIRELLAEHDLEP